jgi:hypothetical protein
MTVHRGSESDGRGGWTLSPASRRSQRHGVRPCRPHVTHAAAPATRDERSRAASIVHHAMVPPIPAIGFDRIFGLVQSGQDMPSTPGDGRATSPNQSAQIEFGPVVSSLLVLGRARTCCLRQCVARTEVYFAFRNSG